MNSIPSETLNQIEVDGLCHRLLEKMGFEEYSEALNFAGGTGQGRVAEMIWQAVFQHMLVRRRNLCVRAQQDFYEVEKKAERAVGRLWKKRDHLFWILVYIQTAKILLPEDQPEIWEYAQRTIKEWSTS